MRNVGIGQVVEVLEAGGRARLPQWNGKGMFVFLVKPVEHPGDEENGPQIALPEGCEDMFTSAQRPFVMLRCADGSVVPWTPSQTDLLATSWETTDGTF